MIGCGKSICNNLSEARSREWLETNGIGGFACSSITGMNTRRYHGLLTAATKPPVGRVVLLSKLEETLVIGDQRFDLGTNQYQGAVHPTGHQFLTGFRLDPFPISTFECGGVRIEKAMFMVHDSNTTVVEYRVLDAATKQNLQLEIRPLIAFRDYHSTTHENSSLNPNVRLEEGLTSVEPYTGLPRLFLAHNAAHVNTQGDWYRRFHYTIEADRGLDAVEDLFNPLTLTFSISKKQPATVIASTEPQSVSSAENFRRNEIERRAKIVASVPLADPFAAQLALAADQFLVRRGDGYTIMAGYPWFTDWGRDTMIALPGLTLPTGNTAIAKGILLQFAKHVDQGMLPNRFPDAGEAPEFNTVDATLWFFEAIRAYLQYAGDEQFVRDGLYDVLKDIVAWHTRGTRYNIHMDASGLLEAGEPGVQLTWMDAKIGDWVVTPRSGMPVEIQALWFNALKIMEDLAGRFGEKEESQRYHTLAGLVNYSFNRLFWNNDAGCLFDNIVGAVADGSIRPNQIFAVSLHHSMLSMDRAAQVLEVVERHLLTPLGLRSLSPEDPSYKGKYSGGPLERDSAYHQGTVWPWLLGPCISAYCKIHGSSERAREHARALLKPLETHLNDAALGQISEVADGSSPYQPGGCFAQAWSVAEILRVICEEIQPVSAKGHSKLASKRSSIAATVSAQ